MVIADLLIPGTYAVDKTDALRNFTRTCCELLIHKLIFQLDGRNDIVVNPVAVFLFALGVKKFKSRCH